VERFLERSGGRELKI